MIAGIQALTGEVHINTTIHEDNLGIIVDLLSVSFFFFWKEQWIQTESKYPNLLEKHSSRIDGNMNYVGKKTI